MVKCPECNQNYNSFYCQPCNSGHFRDNFKNWTSGDEHIDKVIQESQINASDELKFLEWIEYSNLENIEHVAEGGFGNVYKAIWKDGPIKSNWDEIKKVFFCFWITRYSINSIYNGINTIIIEFQVTLYLNKLIKHKLEYHHLNLSFLVFLPHSRILSSYSLHFYISLLLPPFVLLVSISIFLRPTNRILL